MCENLYETRRGICLRTIQLYIYIYKKTGLDYRRESEPLGTRAHTHTHTQTIPWLIDDGNLHMANCSFIFYILYFATAQFILAIMLQFSNGSNQPSHTLVSKVCRPFFPAPFLLFLSGSRITNCSCERGRAASQKESNKRKGDASLLG